LVAKSQKAEVVAKLKKTSEEASIAFVADHTELSVAEITNLRKQLKEKAKCFVVKNTLAERAFEDSDFAQINEYLVGPSLLIFGEGEDVAQPIKAFLEYQKQVTPKLAIKGGAMPGEASPLDPKAIEAIGKLPPKEVILGQIAGSLTATPSQIVQTINSLIGDIGQLAEKIAEKNGK
jgi:large subunit ribosomal protein L10